MNARLIGAVMVLSAGVMGGCATSHPQNAKSAQYRPLQTCQQVTGSRNRASRAHTNCEPVGYSFTRYTIEEVHAWGENDLNKALRLR